MHKSVIISAGTVIDPASKREGLFDILIEEGKISAIEKPGAFSNMKDIENLDAKGCWVVPGFIDLHVHFREPGFEWKETVLTGSRAAVLGGFSTVCCMPNTNPVNDNAQVTKYILEKAESAGLCNVLPIGAVTVGLKGKQLSQLSELQHAGCVAFSDDGEPIYDSGIMRRALEWCKMSGVVISCHEEDKNLSCGGCMNESALSLKLGLKGMPTVAEDVMVARDIELARYTDSKVHICHVSTARSIELVRRAKHDGIQVSCEVTPHHLTLTEDRIAEYDTSAKMSPPLRSKEDVQALQAALADGTVDAIASDHAPHDLDSKRKEFSEATFGILGLQTSLPLMLQFVRSKTISASRAIELLTSGPASAFGLKAGTLKTGAAADVAIVDINQSWRFELSEIASISKNSPFIGSELVGKTRELFVSGRKVLSKGSLV